MRSLKRDDIEFISITDPRTALALVLTPISRRENIQTVNLRFADVAAEQVVGGGGANGGNWQNPLCAGTFFYDRSYQVRTINRPAPSAPLTPQANVNNALNPAIDVQIEYLSCPEYNISPIYLPLEMGAHRLAGFTTPDGGLNGFMLPALSQVVVTAINRRALVANDETPTDVIIAWFGWVLACPITRWSSAEAVEKLIELGFKCYDKNWPDTDRGNIFDSEGNVLTGTRTTSRR